MIIAVQYTTLTITTATTVLNITKLWSKSMLNLTGRWKEKTLWELTVEDRRSHSCYTSCTSVDFSPGT